MSFFQTTSDVPWVVTPTEKSKYDAMFKTADKDNDNLVTGIYILDLTLYTLGPKTVHPHFLTR